MGNVKIGKTRLRTLFSAYQSSFSAAVTQAQLSHGQPCPPSEKTSCTNLPTTNDK